jgi:sec-independent protein translocase protein TatC
VVGAFVIGMLLTPPDIISQTMLAIPMLLLFELGIIIASIYHTEDQDQQDSSSGIKEKSS